MPCPHRLAPLGCPAVLTASVVRRRKIVREVARMATAASEDGDFRIIAAIATCLHRECDCNSVKAPVAFCKRDGGNVATDFKQCSICVDTGHQSRYGIAAGLQADRGGLE